MSNTQLQNHPWFTELNIHDPAPLYRIQHTVRVRYNSHTEIKY